MASQSGPANKVWLQISFSAAMIIIGTVLPLCLIKAGKAYHIYAWLLALVGFAGLAAQFLMFLKTNGYRPPKPQQ